MRKFLAVFLVVALCGCAGTKYRITSGEGRPPFAGEVLVFDKVVPSSVSYRLMGDFVLQKQWYGSSGQTSKAAVMEAARKGANGILIEKTGVRVTAWSWASPYTAGKLLWVENYQQAKTPYVKPEVTPAKAPVEGRLEQLEALKQKGKITEEEYAERRAAILNDL